MDIKEAEQTVVVFDFGMNHLTRFLSVTVRATIEYVCDELRWFHMQEDDWPRKLCWVGFGYRKAERIVVCTAYSIDVVRMMRCALSPKMLSKICNGVHYLEDEVVIDFHVLICEEQVIRWLMDAKYEHLWVDVIYVHSRGQHSIT